MELWQVFRLGEGMGVMKSHIEILSETFLVYSFCLEFWQYSEHEEQENYGQLNSTRHASWQTFKNMYCTLKD